MEQRPHTVGLDVMTSVLFTIQVMTSGVLCSIVTVRLINGNAPNEGAVEVQYKGQWGSVCGSNWRTEEANVVCRQLGYPSASQAWQNAHFGQGSGPVLLSNVACDGHESRIDQCDYRGWLMSSCSHYYDVGVTCDVTTPSSVVVRLADGNTPHEGRVEVFYRCEWGTICSTSHWGIEEANVICRQLGYISANQAWWNTHFGQGSGPILLNNVVCRGSESSIDRCDHTGWYNHDCSYHRYDIGVKCNETSPNLVPVRLTNGSFPYEGRLEIYHDGQWGTVCHDGWSIEDANVICRQLGYPPSSHAWSGAHFGQGSGPILLSNVACNGTESNIDLCEHSGWFNHSCSHAEDAGVTCGEQLIVNTSSPVSIRLVNGDTPNEGRVEVYYKCHWGTICHNGWSIRDANVICRQLGYPSASQAWHSAHFGRGSGLIVLSNVACRGNESSIDLCHHSGWYVTSGCNHYSYHVYYYSEVYYCGHYYDVGVTCDVTTPSSVVVRLADGNTPHEGRVEVFYRCEWGTICGSSHWGIEEANVVCRQLGYTSATQTWRRAHFGQGSGPILLDNVECRGSESRIDQCDHTGWYNLDCWYYYGDIGVKCNEIVLFSVPVRLTNGSFPYEGRIEIYHDGQWGTVCDDGWSIEDANVICRQLGYPPASQAWQGSHFGEGSGPILLRNVACNGTESNIDLCEHSGWFNHSCSHTEDAGVTCGEQLIVNTSSPVSVRLVKGDAPNEGRVEVYYKCHWGTVCHQDWTIIDAHVICRQLGYPSASQAWHSAHFGRGSGPILLSNVVCHGNESSIDQCQHSGWYVTSGCRHNNDAGVTCDLASPSEGYTQPPEISGCPDDVIIPVISSSNQASHIWTPPMTSDNSNSSVDVTFTCQVTPPGECYQAGHGTFPVGISTARYTARDQSGNENICDFRITVTVVGITCPNNITAFASPGLNEASVNWIEPDLTGWGGPTNFTSTASPGDQFLIGTRRVSYQQQFPMYGVSLECSFFVTMEGQCELETYEDLTWPVTSAGSTAKSVERCPLMTMNAGQPRGVRNCSLVDPPVYFQWEEYEPSSCGEYRNEVTLADVEKVEVSTGNVVEVAEFLVNQTSASPEDADVEAVSNILVNIVGAGSGDVQVTELVLESVSNVIMNTPDSQTPNINAGNSSAIIQSVERQVSLTLRQEGQVSIRQDTIHVEAVSLDPVQSRNGLSFVSVRQPGQGSPQEGSLVGTEIKTFMDAYEIPKGIDVVASVQLPRNIVDSIRSADNNSSVQLQVGFLVYADDTLFQSASIREYQGQNNSTRKVAGSVVSLTVENVELVNLSDPVVIIFKKPDNATAEKLETIQCVSWNFELEDRVGDWSPAGCARAQPPNEQVRCDCYHATNFAILVDVKGQTPANTPSKRALDIISKVGCALSIVALAITLIIYLAVRKLRSGKSRQIFIHFCFSLLMLYFVFVAGVDNAKGSEGGCVFVAALLHYLTLSTMMWMAVEARNMYVSTVKVFPEDTPRYMLKACLIAWGSPLIVLTITLAAATHHYGTEHYCFLEPGLVLYLGLLPPIGVILIHNIITFILVMRSLRKVREASRSQQISKRLQNAVGISALMGLTWCFAFLVIIEGSPETNFAFQLIFCLANSLQGVVVFIMFCVRREEVRSAVIPYLSCLGRRLTIARPAKSNDAEMVSTSAVPTSPSSIQTSSFDVSIAGNQ
ncbi:uncharacterized protein LOC119725091 [Patiria miniata]|uniref:Uncharacterized protein n=1 Tax=Patiria miniata TaxID=46514 RepID=A0A913ZMV0_PATMI|nr:uncharacterized protein LOC119725091 [Patiria miniata]